MQTILADFENCGYSRANYSAELSACYFYWLPKHYGYIRSLQRTRIFDIGDDWRKYLLRLRHAKRNESHAWRQMECGKRFRLPRASSIGARWPSYGSASGRRSESGTNRICTDTNGGGVAA